MQLVLCQMVFGTNMLSLFIEHRRIYCVYSNVTWRKLRKYCAYMDLFKSWPHLCSMCYVFFLNNLIFFLNSARETIDPNFRTRESPRISVNVNIRYRWYWISTRVENRGEKKKKNRTWNIRSTFSRTPSWSKFGSANLPISSYTAVTMSVISSLVMQPSPLMS